MDTIRDKQIIEEILKEKINEFIYHWFKWLYWEKFYKKSCKKRHKNFCRYKKKKKKKIKNVTWLVGRIDKNWRELARSDVLLHFATVGAYKKNADIDEAYEFNVIKSSKLLLNAINSNCKKWIIISTNKEEKIEKLINKNKITTHTLKSCILIMHLQNLCLVNYVKLTRKSLT